MNTSVREILEVIDRWSEADRRELAHEILRGVSDPSPSPIEGEDQNKVVKERYPVVPIPPPRDEWERRLLAIASHCGTTLSDLDLSSEGLYD